MRRRRFIAFGWLGLLAGAASLGAPRAVAPADGARLADAARGFLATLTSDHRDAASFGFADAVRLDWNFVPRKAPGLNIGSMSDDERRAAHELLRAALSTTGYLKVTTIMQLEEVLHDLESRPGREATWRDPGLYRFSIFGTPTTDSAWGWKIEGHHVSLNFTMDADAVVSVTPSFLGANPAEVRTGALAGMKVLAAEERLAFRLLNLLDATPDGAGQSSPRERAVIATTAMGVIMSPDRTEEPPRAGLPASAMTAEQREVLRRLIVTYVRSFRSDIASRMLDGWADLDLDALNFAWAGATTPDAPHYYRIHGPSWMIEYDNTQNGGNHVHTAWRDFERDFGGDLLQHHHRHEHADEHRE